MKRLDDFDAAMLGTLLRGLSTNPAINPAAREQLTADVIAIEQTMINSMRNFWSELSEDGKVQMRAKMRATAGSLNLDMDELEARLMRIVEPSASS